jgi:hypothetical protein
MVIMTFEAIAIFHIISMGIMAIKTAQFFTMAGMTFGTVQLRMSTGKAFHLGNGLGMTTGTNRGQILYGTKINISGRMGIMTLATLLISKVSVIAGIMTFTARRDNPFFSGRMGGMTFNTGKVFKMGPAIVIKSHDHIFMAGRTEPGGFITPPGIARGLMRLVTGQAISNLHVRSMLVMTIQTSLILPFRQAMRIMTGGTILLVMGTGH